MSVIDTVAATVKDRAHSFKYIRKATGLRLSDDQFLELIKENRAAPAVHPHPAGGRRRQLHQARLAGREAASRRDRLTTRASRDMAGRTDRSRVVIRPGSDTHREDSGQPDTEPAMEHVTGTISDDNCPIVRDSPILMLRSRAPGGSVGWQGELDWPQDATPPSPAAILPVADLRRGSGQIIFVGPEEQGSRQPARVRFRTSGPFD